MSAGPGRQSPARAEAPLQRAEAPRQRAVAPRQRAKVVLYNPKDVFYTMPLALVAIASELDPARYEIVIVDGRLEDDPEAALAARLEDALCLGVTVMTGAPIMEAIRAARVAKACRSDLPVIWGGWHPSMFGTECLAEAAVDATVQGQGEETFAEILERLGEGRSLEGCLGCCYRDGDGVARANPPRPFRDINAFARHNYDLFDVERFFALKGKRQLDYISSQGCHFRCAFCADPFVYNRKWAGFTPERMGEEIEALWRRWRFDDLNFQDETYFTYPKRVEGFADELIRRKLPITWAGTMRADQCFRLPEETFAKCKQSGLRRVLMGVESGSQQMLDRIKKDIKLEQVYFAAERCKRHGIAMNIPFIVGFPEEPDESVQATLDLVKALRAMSPDFQTPIFYFKPYPGTSITRQAVQSGYSLPCDLDQWSAFDFVGSVGGPWVSPEKFRLIERFKFFQQLAWDRSDGWKRALQRAARWRCRKNLYRLPVEKLLFEWLRPSPQLS